MACRIRKRDEWTARILLEAKGAKDAVFTTLTYSDEYLPENSSLSIEDLQLWLKRLRALRTRSRLGPTRYFACGEYGDQWERPHYHAILFGDRVSVPDHIHATWGMGRTQTSLLTEGRARYVAKYTTKSSSVLPGSFDGRRPEFATMSVKPGIGRRAGEAVVKALVKKRLGVLYGSSEDDPGKTILDILPGSIRIGRRSYPLDRHLREVIASGIGGIEKGSLREALVSDAELCYGGDEEIMQGAVDKAILKRRTDKARRKIVEGKQL